MTDLREDVIAAVRFGCSFRQAADALTHGRLLVCPPSRKKWYRNIGQLIDNMMLNEDGADDADTRNWIIAPADATQAEIDEAQRRCEKGKTGRRPAIDWMAGAELDEMSDNEVIDEAIKSLVRDAMTMVSGGCNEQAAKLFATARELDNARDLVKKWGAYGGAGIVGRHEPPA